MFFFSIKTFFSIIMFFSIKLLSIEKFNKKMLFPKKNIFFKKKKNAIKKYIFFNKNVFFLNFFSIKKILNKSFFSLIFFFQWNSFFSIQIWTFLIFKFFFWIFFPCKTFSKLIFELSGKTLLLCEHTKHGPECFAVSPALWYDICRLWTDEEEQILQPGKWNR